MARRNNRQEWLFQTAMRERVQRLFVPRLQVEIRAAMRRMADAYQRHDAAAMQAARNGHKQRMGKLLTQLWRMIGTEAAQDVLDGFKSSPSFARRKEMGREVPTVPYMDDLVAAWIHNYGAQQITQIVDTTIMDVQRVIDNGLRDGLGELDIADAIRAVAPVKSASRAQTIARTETHYASQQNALNTVRAIGGKEPRKRWVSSMDERSRSDHIRANGQTVPLDQPFIIGGIELDTPGDQMAGAPRQTINCRCIVVFVYD